MSQSLDPLEALDAELHEFPSPEVRIAALRAVLPMIETQIELSRQAEPARLRDQHASEGTHPDDAGIDRYELETHLLHVLPQVVRGGFLLAAWSTLEACTKDLAAFASSRLQRPLGKDPWVGGFVKATAQVFGKALCIPPFESAEVENLLKRFAFVRAALVHHNAEVSRLPADLQGRLALEVEGLYEESDLHHRYFVPTRGYLERSLSVIDRHLSYLRGCVSDAVYGSSRKDA